MEVFYYVGIFMVLWVRLGEVENIDFCEEVLRNICNVCNCWLNLFKVIKVKCCEFL